MKKIAIVTIVVSLLMSLFCVYYFSGVKTKNSTTWYKDKDTYQGAEDVYDYSNKTDKLDSIDIQEWNEFLFVPEAELETMSTETLLLTTLDYPFLVDIYLFDSYREGYNKLKSANNVIGELISRRDMTEVLTDFYLNLDLNKIKETDENSVINMTFINLLYSDDDVIERLNISQRKALIYKGYENLKQYYSEYSDYYALAPLESLVGKLLYVDNVRFRALVDRSESLKSLIEGEAVGIDKGVHSSLFDQIGEIVENDYLRK